VRAFQRDYGLTENGDATDVETQAVLRQRHDDADPEPWVPGKTINLKGE
jgi:hypothetical protein